MNFPETLSSPTSYDGKSSSNTENFANNPSNTDNADVEKNEPKKYQVYPQRFLMLGIFCFGSIMSGYPFEQFSIVSDILTEYYNVSEMLFSWTAMIFMIGYIVGTYPAIWLFRNFGLRIGFLVGMVGTSIGFWINCFAIHRDRFWVAILGQACAACFQPAFLNVGPMLSYKWFGENEVSKACSVAIMSNIIGSAIGTLVPPLVITSKNNFDIMEKQMSIMLYTEAAVCTAGTVVAFFLFREKPPTPPCRAQEEIEAASADSRGSGLLQDTLSMLRNPKYYLTVIPYGISYGLWSSMLTVLNQQILSIYPKAERDLGFLGLLYQFSGCLGMFLFGALLDKTRKYKELALIVYAGMSLTIAIYTIDKLIFLK